MNSFYKDIELGMNLLKEIAAKDIDSPLSIQDKFEFYDALLYLQKIRDNIVDGRTESED